ncbi:uncharacterized protein LOC134228517 [Saccostrea cucullata]|uniref:uncharacterized protein LOC134228517 n=1 Tax=Saccostrea cuccullata TaxID=36930 RepID=UPI002ED1C580
MKIQSMSGKTPSSLEDIWCRSLIGFLIFLLIYLIILCLMQHCSNGSKNENPESQEKTETCGCYCSPCCSRTEIRIVPSSSCCVCWKCRKRKKIEEDENCSKISSKPSTSKKDLYCFNGNLQNQKEEFDDFARMCLDDFSFHWILERDNLDQKILFIFLTSDVQQRTRDLVNKTLDGLGSSIENVEVLTIVVSHKIEEGREEKNIERFKPEYSDNFFEINMVYDGNGYYDCNINKYALSRFRDISEK